VERKLGGQHVGAVAAKNRETVTRGVSWARRGGGGGDERPLVGAVARSGPLEVFVNNIDRWRATGGVPDHQPHHDPIRRIPLK